MMLHFILKVFTFACAAFVCTANAYTIKEKFGTEHFALYEVILGKGEVYDNNLKQIIASDSASRNKFQTSTAVFEFGSVGLNGTIKEPMLGIITTENYSLGPKATFSYDDNAKNATFAGIYLTFEQLSKIADNRNVNALVLELVKLPLLLSNVPVSMVSKNYRGDLYYTVDSKAVVIDFAPIDSIFYKKDKLENLKANCRINMLLIADRSISHVPFFISAHGAVNDISCK
ncbi:MAG: hypothetical protein ACI4UM_04380 [Succinivibrio sp.]